MPIAQSAVAFVTNCMLALLSASGMLRFVKPPWFGTLRNAAMYVLITAGISPAIAALAGAFVQILGGLGKFRAVHPRISLFLRHNLTSIAPASITPLFLVRQRPCVNHINHSRRIKDVCHLDVRAAACLTDDQESVCLLLRVRRPCAIDNELGIFNADSVLANVLHVPSVPSVAITLHMI